MNARIATFAERLHEAMDTRGIKSVELAKVSGVSQSDISNYRAGRYEASQLNLQKLAEALDVDIPWLMGFDVPVGRYRDAQKKDPIDEYVDGKKDDARKVLFDLSKKVREEDIPQIEAILRTFIPEDE